MKPIDRLIFHVKDGVLRRWSMWNEEEFPEWAIKEGGMNEDRYKIFQHIKAFQSTEEHPEHPMAYFGNWPYWLVLDLCNYVFGSPYDYQTFLFEIEGLLEAIVDELDRRYSENESNQRR